MTNHRSCLSLLGLTLFAVLAGGCAQVTQRTPAEHSDTAEPDGNSIRARREACAQPYKSYFGLSQTSVPRLEAALKVNKNGECAITPHDLGRSEWESRAEEFRTPLLWVPLIRLTIEAVHGEPVVTVSESPYEGGPLFEFTHPGTPLLDNRGIVQVPLGEEVRVNFRDNMGFVVFVVRVERDTWNEALATWNTAELEIVTLQYDGERFGTHD